MHRIQLCLSVHDIASNIPIIAKTYSTVAEILGLGSYLQNHNFAGLALEQYFLGCFFYQKLFELSYTQRHKWTRINVRFSSLQGHNMKIQS